MPVLPEGPLRAAGAHDHAHGGPVDHALQVGASGRGEGETEDGSLVQTGALISGRPWQIECETSIANIGARNSTAPDGSFSCK
jgi:hypothetical protein